MSDIISAVDKVLTSYKVDVRDFLSKHPDQMFMEVDDSIYTRAIDFINDLDASVLKDMILSVKMPTTSLNMWMPQFDKDASEHTNIFVLSQLMEEPEKIELLWMSNVPELTVVSTICLRTGDITSHVGWRDAVKMSAMCIFILSMLCQPSFTKSEIAGTRQSRRSAERKYGIPQDKWTKIEWDLNKPRLEVGESVGTGRHMPLHFTRGHWRRAKKHHSNVVLRNDGEWYKWISGFWSGHPAYGTIRSVHAPKVGFAA